MKKFRVTIFEGGAGSGNFGHAGRPGQRGGSAPSKGGTSGKKFRYNTEQGATTWLYKNKDFQMRQKMSQAQMKKKVMTSGTPAQKELLGKSADYIHQNIMNFVNTKKLEKVIGKKKASPYSWYAKMPTKERVKSYIMYYDTMRASGHEPKNFKDFQKTIAGLVYASYKGKGKKK